MNKYKFQVEVSVTGDVLSQHETFEEAVFEILENETEDLKNKNYEADWYVIREIETGELT